MILNKSESLPLVPGQSLIVKPLTSQIENSSSELRKVFTKVATPSTLADSSFIITCTEPVVTGFPFSRNSASRMDFLNVDFFTLLEASAGTERFVLETGLREGVDDCCRNCIKRI